MKSPQTVNKHRLILLQSGLACIERLLQINPSAGRRGHVRPDDVVVVTHACELEPAQCPTAMNAVASKLIRWSIYHSRSNVDTNKLQCYAFKAWAIMGRVLRGLAAEALWTS